MTEQRYSVVVPYMEGHPLQDEKAFALAMWYGNLTRMGATVTVAPSVSLLPPGAVIRVEGQDLVFGPDIKILHVCGSASLP